MNCKKTLCGTILHMTGLKAAVNSTPVLHGVTLGIAPGDAHVLMGANGSGKSSLVHVLMGDPRYQLSEGAIYWKSNDLKSLSIDERARTGMFIAQQHPIIIPGLSVYNLLKEAVRSRDPKNFSLIDFSIALENAADILQIDKTWLHRPYDQGFSGGQMKRLELLQMFVLKPDLAILDEIDSGLDVDSLQQIGSCIALYKKQNPSFSLLIITHNIQLIELIDKPLVHIMSKGLIVQSGDFRLSHVIQERGYNAFTDS
jgi:Fe-S cluster assembly ATP-binding protein